MTVKELEKTLKDRRMVLYNILVEHRDDSEIGRFVIPSQEGSFLTLCDVLEMLKDLDCYNK